MDDTSISPVLPLLAGFSPETLVEASSVSKGLAGGFNQLRRVIDASARSVQPLDPRGGARVTTGQPVASTDRSDRTTGTSGRSGRFNARTRGCHSLTRRVEWCARRVQRVDPRDRAVNGPGRPLDPSAQLPDPAAQAVDPSGRAVDCVGQVDRSVGTNGCAGASRRSIDRCDRLRRLIAVNTGCYRRIGRRARRMLSVRDVAWAEAATPRWGRAG